MDCVKGVLATNPVYKKQMICVGGSGIDDDDMVEERRWRRRMYPRL
jgi:hypothetical protein